jgi:putative transposase
MRAYHDRWCFRSRTSARPLRQSRHNRGLDARCKAFSSTFVKERDTSFAWQAGYGVFSVEHKNVDNVARYVRGQEEHHRKVSFQDEFRALMREHGVDWDEQYVWD